MDKSVKRIRTGNILFTLFLMVVISAGWQAVSYAADTYTDRFTVVNNCGNNVWMWVVPPGPDEAEAQSQFWETKNGGTNVCKNTGTCAERNYQWKFEFTAGETKTFSIPDKGSASNKIYFNMGCVNSTGDFPEMGDCIIGGEFGANTLGNDLTSSNTWFEATWGCSDSSGVNCNVNPSDTSLSLTAVDWMDLSLVDGYTVPMKIELGAGEATAHNCEFNNGESWDGIEDLGFIDFASCPTEDDSTMYSENQVISNQLKNGGINLLTEDGGNYINCAAPHTWLSGNNVMGTTLSDTSTLPLIAGETVDTLNATNWYGCKSKCGGASDTPSCVCPECSREQCLEGPFGNQYYSVAQTAYVRRLKAMGVEAYTWQYDDDSGNKHCDYGVTVTLTLCPAKAGQKPYETTQAWKYDSSSSSCVIADSGDSNTYASYFDCIKPNIRYTRSVTSVSSVSGTDLSSTSATDSISYCVPDSQGEYADYADCAGEIYSVIVPTSPLWAWGVIGLGLALLWQGGRMLFRKKG